MPLALVIVVSPNPPSQLDGMLCYRSCVLAGPVIAWSQPFIATVVHHAGNHLLGCWLCPDSDPFWSLLGPALAAGSSSPSSPGLPHQVDVQSPCPVHDWRQSAPKHACPPPASPPPADMSLDLQPDVAAHIEEPTLDEVLSLDLQLAVAFEVLHHLRMAEKSRSLSTEELDLVEFLVAQVALLSSSLMVEVVCKAAITVSPVPPSSTCEVMDMQPSLIISLAPPPMAMDAPVVVARSSPTPAVAWEHQAIGLGECFNAELPDPLLWRCVRR
jgi:hypothetical protein